MASTSNKSHEVSNAQSALLNPEHSIQVRGNLEIIPHLSVIYN